MTCNDGRLLTTLTQTVARNRKKGFTKATLAVATSLALTLANHAAVAGTTRSFTEYVPVVSVVPVYRNVTVQEPQKICRPANRHHRSHHRSHNRSHNRGDNGNHHRHNDNRNQHRAQPGRSHRTRYNTSGEVFVAGVIGGAIGRELSRSVNGRPSTGATIAGAVIGSALASSAVKDQHRRVSHQSANSVSNQRYLTPIYKPQDSVRQHSSSVSHNRHNVGHGHGHNRDRHHRHNRHHCSTTMQTRTERQQNGFTVTYQYHGRQYQTRTRHHPGDRIAITVTLDPQKH